jgi:hypothetical protein
MPRTLQQLKLHGAVQRSSKVSRPRGQLDLHAMSVPTARVAILRVRCALLSHRCSLACTRQVHRIFLHWVKAVLMQRGLGCDAYPQCDAILLLLKSDDKVQPCVALHGILY